HPEDLNQQNAFRQRGKFSHHTSPVDKRGASDNLTTPPGQYTGFDSTTFIKHSRKPSKQKAEPSFPHRSMQAS
ncbi:hypothetical protein, partial [Klebsiella variicola]|uniref:hypothetical protein n=1 Tax=Klebsiella variicola TaxID=244366 RepID=UPI001955EB03